VLFPWVQRNLSFHCTLPTQPRPSFTLCRRLALSWHHPAPLISSHSSCPPHHPKAYPDDDLENYTRKRGADIAQLLSDSPRFEVRAGKAPRGGTKTLVTLNPPPPSPDAAPDSSSSSSSSNNNETNTTPDKSSDQPLSDASPPPLRSQRSAPADTVQGLGFGVWGLGFGV
jgi:hypothetical protein